ncbi:hypothetical protein [Streptomyces sp. Wb2n-11]|uniref:hypothetical protein n=1 Tax=Streptomyces sp. Wb2n-11 TaxID=1030533 RepID=UPI000AD943A9|nr:hypothetical protein [Streptomyces sp. Wb2n-11]
MATSDPTKHLLGYGRQDPATGMLHGHVRHPDGNPPVPYGCRWCGTAQGGHGRRWKPGQGMHAWEQPTQAQIKARMLARRNARLTAEPAKYHATTNWAADLTGEEGIPYCADCKTDTCFRWMRIQARLDPEGWGVPRPSGRTPGGWGCDATSPW